MTVLRLREWSQTKDEKTTPFCQVCNNFTIRQYLNLHLHARQGPVRILKEQVVKCSRCGQVISQKLVDISSREAGLLLTEHSRWHGKDWPFV